jgi:predicted membrane-bound spermidine synthase
MKAVICAIFFLSGASALIFESLWFHQAGLVFGNGVWASSLVLAAFMAGLALGNAAAARFGSRVDRPVRTYALLELGIGVSGVALVFGLPFLVPVLAPVLRPALDEPFFANGLRMAGGFALMLLPSTAMGATLPLLVKALLARDVSFGSVLGRLYGWNTLGAVAGALATEAVLLGSLGVRGSAFFAMGLNALVAVAGVLLSGRWVAAMRETEASEGAAEPIPVRARWLLAAAFLSGFSLLALEVVWFRFLQLWIHASSLVFAVMLAVVLSGIALGSLAGGAILRRLPEAYRHAPWVSLLSGISAAGLYALHGQVPTPTTYVASMETAALRAALLMAPVCLLSGVVFTWLGAAIDREISPASRAAGWMTFWNTLGSGVGPLVAGFLLLPLLGMEISLVGLALGYGGVAMLALMGMEQGVTRLRGLGVAAATSVAIGVLFPYGLMLGELVPRAIDRYVVSGGGPIVDIQEGRTETIVLLERSAFGEPVSRTLLTNGHKMTGNEPGARRYMNLYAYLPAAFHPKVERSLLISYGLGNTARALLDSPDAKYMTVVDISREILGIADRIFEPGRNPLADPRTKVHVEDGRYFLQVSDDAFDLITGEPPPPKNAGVVNLYTREYFQLTHARLAPGGMHTYWLPIHNLSLSDSRAIVAAYCEVFADCSLWLGTSADWMLVGTRGHDWAGSAERFERIFDDPVVGPDLAELGFEEPALMATTFLMDSEQIEGWLEGALPLVDDFPKRLANETPLPSDVLPDYAAVNDAMAARERFRTSSFTNQIFTPALHARALELYEMQAKVNTLSALGAGPPSLAARMKDLHELLLETPYKTLPLWMLGTDPEFTDAAGRARPMTALAAEQLAYQALAERDYTEAATQLRVVTARTPQRLHGWRLRVFALCLAGRVEEADQLVHSLVGAVPDEADERAFWDYISTSFGVSVPYVS